MKCINTCNDYVYSSMSEVRSKYSVVGRIFHHIFHISLGELFGNSFENTYMIYIYIYIYDTTDQCRCQLRATAYMDFD